MDRTSTRPACTRTASRCHDCATLSEVEAGRADRADNVLKNAPHTAAHVVSDTWAHAYGREAAAFPLPYVRAAKFWPTVRRVDDAYGDRNLVCTCPPMSAYAEEA